MGTVPFFEAKRWTVPRYHAQMLRRPPVLWVLFIAGCSGFQGPKVSVQDVMVTQATDEGLGVTLLLELRNPNRAPLELHEFHYALWVDSTEVYEGHRAAGATLKALGTRSLALPAVIAYDRLDWAPDQLPEGAAYRLNGVLRYNAPNMLVQILLDASMQRPGVDFAKRGLIQIKSGDRS